ncbi:DUF5683 domain-containing protein [Heliobacterium chlorum]
MAALWSTVIPGFGQIYNREYLKGFILIFLEILINNFSNLNESIFLRF